ncbi:MAG: flagellar basal-body rod protein FlgG [Myxococcota bacterium]
MRALYAAATGMAAQQTNLDTVANNLANVQTAGYKRSRASFQDLYYQELTHGGRDASSARIDVGSGVQVSGVDKTFQAGSINESGNPLDVAIMGNRGFFQLQDQGGNQFFTRDGQFRLDANGQVVSASGLSLGGLTIPEGANQVIISPEGEVNAFFDGSPDPSFVGQLPIVDFQNPAGLRSVGGNLFQETVQSGQAMQLDSQESGVTVRQGAFEGSNVDVATELVNMILTQRAYELNSKAVQAADDTLRVVTSLRR